MENGIVEVIIVEEDDSFGTGVDFMLQIALKVCLVQIIIEAFPLQIEVFCFLAEPVYFSIKIDALLADITG